MTGFNSPTTGDELRSNLAFTTFSETERSGRISKRAVCRVGVKEVLTSYVRDVTVFHISLLVCSVFLESMTGLKNEYGF